MLEKALQDLGWAMPVPSADKSLLRDHWPLHAHLGAELLSASALITLLKKYMQITDLWQKEDTIRSVPGWFQSWY